MMVYKSHDLRHPHMKNEAHNVRQKWEMGDGRWEMGGNTKYSTSLIVFFFLDFYMLYPYVS